MIRLYVSLLDTHDVTVLARAIAWRGWYDIQRIRQGRQALLAYGGCNSSLENPGTDTNLVALAEQAGACEFSR